MQHMFGAHPGKDPEHMILSYAVSLSQNEARTLKPVHHKLDIDLTNIPVPLTLYNGRDVAYPHKMLGFRSILGGDPILPDHEQPKWQIEDFFEWLTFEVRDIRKAYVLLRRVALEIENSMILSIPLSPYYGFTKTFDVRFDVPREITEFEPLRRSVLVRGK